MEESNNQSTQTDTRKNKKIQKPLIAIIVVILILALAIFGINYFTNNTNQGATLKNSITNSKSAQASSQDLDRYKKIIIDKQFPAPTTARDSTIINGILAGYSSNSVTSVTKNGVIDFSVDQDAVFYTMNLIPDPNHPGSKIFSKTAAYDFNYFKSSVPLGTVIQAYYSLDSSGKPILKQIDTYIDQKF